MPTGYNVHANGIRHHLIHHPGRGRQMLLIPGITSPAVTWGFVAERLADGFDVHVLDVRGRGLSQAGALDYSLDAMAEDVVALVRHLEIENPILLGHSMGARIAIRASRMDQSGFGRLALVDPPVSGPMRRAYPMPLQWYLDAMEIARRGCSAEDMRPYCPGWSDAALALRAEWLHTCEPEAVRMAHSGFHEDDIHQDLPTLRLPVRLVCAGAAPVIEASDIEEIATLVPHLEVRIVEGAGHMIPWDDLEGFLAAVMDL